jgi:hypothetical protein
VLPRRTVAFVGLSAALAGAGCLSFDLLANVIPDPGFEVLPFPDGHGREDGWWRTTLGTVEQVTDERHTGGHAMGFCVGPSKSYPTLDSPPLRVGQGRTFLAKAWVKLSHPERQWLALTIREYYPDADAGTASGLGVTSRPATITGMSDWHQLSQHLETPADAGVDGGKLDVYFYLTASPSPAASDCAYIDDVWLSEETPARH